MASILRLSARPVALALCALLAACGADDGGDGATATKTLTYSGTIVDGLDDKPVAGVQVCLPSHPDVACSTTDDKGAFSLTGVPAETKVKGSLTKDGYIPVWATFITRDADNTLNASILQKPLVEAAFKAVGKSIDFTQGAVLFLAYDPAVGQGVGLPGIAGALDPKAGDGPLYNQGSALPSAASATSDSGTGLWTNVPPGDYALQLTGDGRDCPGTFHWKADKAGWISVEAKAGHVTYVYVDCAKK